MSQQLSYLQVVDDNGRAVVEPGVVRADQVDTLGRKNPLRGRGLRLYQTESTSDGLSFGSLSVLMVNVRRAIRELLVAEPLFSTSTDALLKAMRDETSFASLDLTRHSVEVLNLSAARSLDDLVATWARDKDVNHVLVELSASPDVFRSLQRQIESDVSQRQVRITQVVPRAPTANPAVPIETAASASRREVMVRDWVDAAAVSDLLGSRANNKSQLPTRLRAEGRILGVWVVADNRYRYPLWQFNQNQLIPEFREILSLLRSEDGVAGGRKTSGWEEIEWLCAPHALLGKKRPSDLLATAPDRVLAAARQEFSEGRDARW